MCSTIPLKRQDPIIKLQILPKRNFMLFCTSWMVTSNWRLLLIFMLFCFQVAFYTTSFFEGLPCKGFFLSLAYQESPVIRKKLLIICDLTKAIILSRSCVISLLFCLFNPYMVLVLLSHKNHGGLINKRWTEVTQWAQKNVLMTTAEVFQI